VELVRSFFSEVSRKGIAIEADCFHEFYGLPYPDIRRSSVLSEPILADCNDIDLGLEADDIVNQW
jgi:hypothetical protein